VLIDPRTNTRAGQDEPRIGITGVLDTEEEIWSPKYGLKGKIDVTVEAHVLETPADSKNRVFKPHNSSDPQIYPLEIKTGRQPSGIEHIAQTMLYTLLLSDRYSKLYFFHKNKDNRRGFYSPNSWSLSRGRHHGWPIVLHVTR
jgi:DNA replication ATP-dependent helicase Dna2